MNTIVAAAHPPLPSALSDSLEDLAYQLTVTYGMRLRVITQHGREVPVHPTPRPLRPGVAETLTATELRLARMIAGGASNRDIAEWFSISPKTVEAHLSRIYRKLDVRSRAGVAYLVGKDSARDHIRADTVAR